MKRLLLTLVFIAVASLFISRAVDYQAASASLTWRQTEILVMRSRTHGCQDTLGKPRSPVSQRIVTGGPAYRAWVLELWRDRARLYCKAARDLSDPVRAIYAVFGPYGSQAVAVARCETGGTFSVYARNGQYLGLFQMGDYARSRYGHGWNPWAQARAAHRYYVDSGRDWSPWQCRPWGLAW